MNETITNYNDKFRLHGYQECYVNHDKIVLRGYYKDGSEIGYEEYHQAELTNYYIK